MLGTQLGEVLLFKFNWVLCINVNQKRKVIGKFSIIDFSKLVKKKGGLGGSKCETLKVQTNMYMSIYAQVHINKDQTPF